MIVLQVTNASDVVASKVGKFFEFLTPDSIDHKAVEDQIIQKMIENLAAEGIEGHIASIHGFELQGDSIRVSSELKVRKRLDF